MKNSSKKTARKSALDIAEKKASRERRKINVYRERREDLPDDVYYVVPDEKAGEEMFVYKLVDDFEPEGESQSGENYRRLPVKDYSLLENGDRVVVNGEDVHTITEVTSRQIVTNFGDKFRKSDGVEWGGGEKEITNKLEKVS